MDGANFRILQSESMIESFSQISPTVKVQEMATVQDIQQYGYEYEQIVIRAPRVEAFFV